MNFLYRSAVTVFRQRLGDRRRDFRVYNQQVIAYAGYRQPNGSIRGDPAYADFTTVLTNPLTY